MTNWSGLRESDSNDSNTDAKSDRMASGLGTNTTILLAGAAGIGGLYYFGVIGGSGSKKASLPDRA
jgi:hypothetical protein